MTASGVFRQPIAFRQNLKRALLLMKTADFTSIWGSVRVQYSEQLGKISRRAKWLAVPVPSPCKPCAWREVQTPDRYFRKQLKLHGLPVQSGGIRKKRF